MIPLDFTVIDVRAERHAASPTLAFRLRLEADAEVEVHNVLLRCQIRIEPARRHYNAREEEALLDIFGGRDRWADTMRPMPWTQVTTLVSAFRGQHEVDVMVPCTYDFEVSSARLLNALEDGGLPLCLLFNGSVFARGEQGMQVSPIAWDREARCILPVEVWREAMDAVFPDTAWIRVDAETLRSLQRYRASQGLVSWDETLKTLLVPALEGTR